MEILSKLVPENLLKLKFEIYAKNGRYGSDGAAKAAGCNGAAAGENL